MKHARYGRYEALELIASGGMGSVYLGRAVGPAGFERLVAIKVMHQHVAADPELRAMFLDEARLAARIRHPNVAATLDVADDGSFIVMELVEGASLKEVLRRRAARREGPVPLDMALRIMLDALEGLHAAHELCDRKGRPLNLVHRDISPHNILVGVDGSARITDFGIAFAEARITSTREGQLKGKLPYMAPEQLEGRPADRRVDVYAAGCVLWELLTGRRLFEADNEAALAVLVMEGPAAPPSALRPELPEAIDAACMQALAELDARFVSAAAFGEALDAAATGSGITVARHRAVATLTDGLGLELAADSSSGRGEPLAARSAAAEPLAPTDDPHEHTPATRRPDEEAPGPGPTSATAAMAGEAPPSEGLPAAARPVVVRSSSPSLPSRPSQAEQALARVAQLDAGGDAAQTLPSEPDQPTEPEGATATSMTAPVPLKSHRALGLGAAGLAMVLLGAVAVAWWTQRAGHAESSLGGEPPVAATSEPVAASAQDTAVVASTATDTSNAMPVAHASGTPQRTGPPSGPRATPAHSKPPTIGRPPRRGPAPARSGTARPPAPTASALPYQPPRL